MTLLKNYLILFFLAFAGICHAQDTLRVKVMTYNLRFGELATLEEIAAHIKSFKPDFVALQEVDCKTVRKRSPHQTGKDFVSELAYHTGMLGLYGKTIDVGEGYYGIGILSNYPYISTSKTLLPWPERSHEPRALLEGVFDMNGDTLVFASTHLDVKLSQTREMQTAFICSHFEDAAYPVIVGGDFNATPSVKAIDNMLKGWFSATNDDLTFPTWKPTVKIDYIFARPVAGWRVVRTQTVQSVLSDHLPIVTELEYINK